MKRYYSAMSVSMQSLYSATKDTYRLKVIAGKEGMNRNVSWMYYTEDESTISFIRGGELAVTTGLHLERSVQNGKPFNDGETAHSIMTEEEKMHATTEYLAHFITELTERNASGLILNTGKYINDIPEEICAMCDRLSFPLLTMPWEIHLIDIMQDYGNRIVSDRQKVMTTEKALSNALFFPEQFDSAQLDGTRFAGAEKYSVILMQIPEEFFNGEEEKIRRYMDFSFNGKLRIMPSEFACILHKNHIVYVFHSDARNVAQTLCTVASHDRYFKGMKIAVSAVCRTPEELSNEYRHAKLALSFCAPEETLCDYNSLGIYRLLAEVQDRRILEAFYEETLGKLAFFSEDKRNDYLNTLSLYLESSGKIQKTAEENATHRNTVNYRIHKIAEMLGIDIQDGQTRYKIQTALYIRKLLKRTECTQEQRL